MSDSKDFIWTTELVREFIKFGKRQYLISDQDVLGLNIDKFIASKQPSKDWEIVSFKLQDGTIFDKKESGLYGLLGDGIIPEKDMIEKCHEIYEVRRIRDNLVFKVGDETNWGKVKGFRIVGETNKMVVEYAAIGDWQFLSSVEKVIHKVLLFTTEDGVEIFKHGAAFYVQDDFNWNIVSHSGIFEKRPFPYFSTREKAEQFILDNKPCLSLNDLLFVWGDMFPSYYKDAPLFKNFEKLAKSKINP